MKAQRFFHRILACLALLSAQQGYAQSPTAPALGFNLFTEQSATVRSSHSEGPVAVGTNLIIANDWGTSFNTAGTFQVGGKNIGLLVGGQVIYSGGNSLQVNSGAYVKIGNSTGSYVWYQDQNNAYTNIRITPGQNYNGSPRIELNSNAQTLGVSAGNNPVFESGLIDFTSAFTTMKASSTAMAALTDNATITESNGTPIPLPHTNLPSQVKITLNSGVNVLNISGTDLNNLTDFTYNNSADANHVLVVNVSTSSSFSWNVCNSAGSFSLSTCPYIIWNFPNVTGNLNIQGNGAVEGTVFAPWSECHKVSNSNIEGQVICKSFIQNSGSGGELHPAPFAPTVTSSTPTVAGFTITSNSTQCLTGNSFTFNNTSTGSNLTYSWNFGDATSSTSTNPSHTYASAGTYTVTLTAAGTAGSNSTSQNVTVNPMVTPSVSIGANPGTSVCSGTSVTFTAMPTNGGTSPSYQWKKNNVNVGTGATYTTSNLSNGDVIAAVLTSNATCATTTTANSSVTMTIGSVTPSVSISSNPGTSICSGTPVTFTANPTNGGTTPTYVWKKNNVTVGTGVSYTDNALANNDQITVSMTSNASCATPNPVSSTVTMAVGSSVTPSVGITAVPGSPICAGTQVTFTASPTNGGSSPAYQWKLNGNNVGSNSNTYVTSTLNNNDVVTAVMTSNASCVVSNPATSNAVTMTVNTNATQPGNFTTSSPIVYQGQVGVTYTVPNVSGVTYNWSYSGTGATISGSGNSVTIDFGITATSGTLSVTASSNAGCGISVPRTLAITVLPYMTFTCSSNNNWNNPANWDGGFVPYGTISVLIPASAPCQPNIPTGNPEVRDFMIEPGADLTIDNGSELTVKGNSIIDGDVCGGYLVIGGSSAQSISGNGTVCNLELDNPGGATITPGDTIHISQTYQPTDGTLTTNGGLELLSDADGTAVILGSTNCNYISGNVIVNKYIHGGRRAFRFLAHPFSTSIGLDQLTDDIDITGTGGAVNGFTPTPTNNASAFWYNPLTGNGSSTNDSTGWIPYTSTDGVGDNAWDPMEGLRILIRGAKGEGLGCCNYTPSPVTLDMTGPVNQCDVTEHASTNANEGYNFIGNPYAANVDLSLTTRGSAIGANFTVWDPNQGVYGAYVCQPFQFSYILPAYSSFIVTSTSNSNNGITFHESDKTSSPATGNLFKTTSFGSDAVQLKILSDNGTISWDRLLIFFDGQSSTVKQANDAGKLLNPSLDFYSLSSDNKKLAVDFRPLANNTIVPLGLRADSQKTYTIKVEDYSVPAGTTLYLKDKFLGTNEVMTQGMEYSFAVNSNPLSQGENRFEISAQSTTGIASTNNGNISVTMNPNPATDVVKIGFKGTRNGTTTVRISNMMGQQVFSQQFTQSNGEVIVPVSELTAGVYMVTVSCGNEQVTERLMKK